MDVYMVCCPLKCARGYSLVRTAHRRLLLQLSLFIANVVQAVGAALSIEWLRFGQVVVGDLCTVQGDCRSFQVSAYAHA
jgi:hypothetical protein